MGILAMWTETTCANPCWEAREDVCRCSCGGANHGVLRTADGVQPQRTARIDGVMYRLEATAPDARENQARAEIYATAARLNGPTYRSWDTNVKFAPARIRNASKDQLAKWPELASYRQQIDAIKASGRYCQQDIFQAWPILLWVKS